MQHINFDFSARAMCVLVFIVRTCACWPYEICMYVWAAIGMRVCWQLTHVVLWHVIFYTFAI